MAKKTETGPNHSQISEAAYLRYLSRGGSDGSDLDDWIEAERALTARFAAPTPAQLPTPTVPKTTKTPVRPRAPRKAKT